MTTRFLGKNVEPRYVGDLVKFMSDRTHCTDKVTHTAAADGVVPVGTPLDSSGDPVVLLANVGNIVSLNLTHVYLKSGESAELGILVRGDATVNVNEIPLGTDLTTAALTTQLLTLGISTIEEPSVTEEGTVG